MTHAARAPQLQPLKPAKGERLALDESAIDAARRDLNLGAVTPHSGPWREDIIKLLNDSLATELVCVLRYKRHHFTAEGLSSPKIAEEFLVHATEEAGHADRLARRIVQLGGEPDFAPDGLSRRSHAEYVAGSTLVEMIREDLVAERIAISSYRELIGYLGERDPTTSRLLKEILAVEEGHADELADLLAGLPHAGNGG
jgi:bacterioferritin